MSKVIVNLFTARYPIYIGSGIIEKFPRVCRKHGVSEHVAIVTDDVVASLYLDEVVSLLRKGGFSPDVIVVSAGERSKNFKTAFFIFTKLGEMKLRRDETVIAFGGGVIGDLAGFVSATYLRGVNLVHLPTTLLAQVDSSIGGKVGINHPLGKNLIGAFHHPLFVFSDVNFLKTLPKREIICGLGEIVKYGIIADKEIFEAIESAGEKIFDVETKFFSEIVFRSSSVKARVVEKDEREKKLRMILNFGHTIGHGIEASLNYKTLKHGEAVLLGMAGEGFIAFKRGILKRGDFERIENLCFKLVGKIPKKLLDKDLVLKHIGYDKKFLKRRLNMYLPVRIGKMKFADNVSMSELSKAVEFIVCK